MADEDDTKLGELLGEYQRRKAEDPTVGVEVLREEAGSLYPALAELAPCLDLVVGEPPPGTIDTAPPPVPPVSSRRRLWWLLAGALVAVLAGAGWWWSGQERAPTRVVVTSYPSADVLLDGVPLEEAVSEGVHELRITRKGFHPVVRDIEVGAGKTLEIQSYLLPLDPFDPQALQALSKSIGILHRAPDPLLPTPSTSHTAVRDEKSDPSPAEEQALAIELGRLPRELQATPSGRYIIAERLYRQAYYRVALRTALELVAAHPERRAPLHLALHSLWGLEQIASPRYAELHARYLLAD